MAEKIRHERSEISMMFQRVREHEEMSIWYIFQSNKSESSSSVHFPLPFHLQKQTRERKKIALKNVTE